MMRDGSRLAFQSLEGMEGLHHDDRAAVPALFRHIPGGRRAHAVYPGFLAALTIGIAASWLSSHYGAPVMLFAMLLGMAFHFLHDNRRCIPGIEFSSRFILRIGVALLGARITSDQIAGLGLEPILMVVAGVATTIVLGVVFSSWLGLKRQLGILTGGAVAICGASAALAIASILPHHKDSERDTILTVVSVTALSTIAMIVYPMLAAAAQLGHREAGFFLGGTIHDVAQVVGAGYMVSPETGDIATYVKLLRVAMLLPVVAVLSLLVSRRGDRASTRRAPLVPWFLVVFALIVGVNSLGVIPSVMTTGTNDLSRWCLVTAIAALGMKTSFEDIIAVGWRPILLMLLETVWIAGLVMISVLNL